MKHLKSLGNALGIQEMNTSEMRMTNGGNWLVVVAVAAITGFIYETLTNPKDTANALKSGADRAAAINF